MKCEAVERFISACIDDELDPTARVELERHLTGCAPCRERLEFSAWTKHALRGAAATPAPDALRQRVQGALRSERAGHVRIGAPGWRSTLLAAAAALFLLGLGGALQMHGPVQEAGVATLFEDVVRAHAAPYPAEVARRDQVPAYVQERVGFPVRSVDFADPSIRFVGARATEVGGRHAVTLRYDMHGRRMTVVAFRRPSQTAELGEPVEQGGRTFRAVRVSGQRVLVVEQDGVVYAVVGDLDHDVGVRLAAQAQAAGF
jgi:anti-sigma factor RsiW